MGTVMPHSTPKALMASDTSTPEATSRWGISTALAEPIRLPSRAVAPMGRAMEAMRRLRARPSTPGPGRPSQRRMCRRKRPARVAEEKISQQIMPTTMSPTVRSGFWGRKTTSRPSTAPVRINCSHSSTAAGGRMLPVP